MQYVQPGQLKPINWERLLGLVVTGACGIVGYKLGVPEALLYTVCGVGAVHQGAVTVRKKKLPPAEEKPF
jgi:hypothetical protein